MLPRDVVELPVEFAGETWKNLSLSVWTCSRAKRIFDVAMVLAMVPLLLPLLGAVALAIMVSCGRPIIFRQTRAGRYGRPFAIFKFRTMIEARSGERHAIAAHKTQEITPIGRLLRRLKLDELPQVWNVLVGDMSLVGPRPKILKQQVVRLDCRPGLTGAATLAFAREERLFAEIPPERLDAFYHEIVLPAKHLLDAQYTSRATILSDLRILLLTAFGRWQNATLDSEAIARSKGLSPLPQDWRSCEPGDATNERNFAELSQACHSIVADSL